MRIQIGVIVLRFPSLWNSYHLKGPPLSRRDKKKSTEKEGLALEVVEEGDRGVPDAVEEDKKGWTERGWRNKSLLGPVLPLAIPRR